ncbi:DUF1893 domain-containing protein [bacterium]|nr:DUF1893 domain-containing protein [bacterium]
MNLQVFDNKGKLIYEHDGHWLHPLFSFYYYIIRDGVDVSQCFLKDKIIGRGAAVIIAKTGIKACHGETVSERALPILKHEQIHITWDKLVDRLPCQTELLLGDDLDIDRSFELLLKMYRVPGVL